MNWIANSLIATCFLTGLVLFTKALTEKGISAGVLNFYFFVLASVGFLALALFRRESFSIDSSAWPLFLGLAVVAIGYNEFFIRALGIAPNAGYVQAVLSINIVLIAVLSIFFFGAEFSLLKSFGVLLTAVGVVILSIAK